MHINQRQQDEKVFICTIAIVFSCHSYSCTILSCRHLAIEQGIQCNHKWSKQLIKTNRVFQSISINLVKIHIDVPVFPRQEFWQPNESIDYTTLYLYLINDTTFCNKYINLVIRLNDTGENCITLQENLHSTMIKNGDTMMHLISKLRKGHQMQFWMFYWSSTDETAWREEVSI